MRIWTLHIISYIAYIITQFPHVSLVLLLSFSHVNLLRIVKLTVSANFLDNFRGGGNAVQIVQRHHFASHLKRMAVVVSVQDHFFAFVKVSGYLPFSPLFSFSRLDFKLMHRLLIDKQIYFILISLTLVGS